MNVNLLVVHGRPRGKTIPFPLGEFLIGRGPECHIRPNSDWVSRQHCLLRVLPTGVSIRDLGSRNGTLVNGTRVIQEQPLHNGDQLQVGPLTFEIQLQQFPARPLPPDPSLPDQDETGIAASDTAELPRLLEEDDPSEDALAPGKDSPKQHAPSPPAS
jgi:pSer/pThr/pTyr-binding forkhead associated (FHA) protein